MAIPLTKRSKEGAVYVRPTAVESNIDGTQGQETEDLIRRARVTERHSPEFLRSECLVHLIRHAIRGEDESRYNSLLPILLTRCETILNSKISQHVPNAEFVREEVLGEFSMLFAREAEDDPPDELDYYEVMFNDAFRTLRCLVLRRERDETEGAQVLSDGSDPNEGQGRPANLPPCRATQEDGVQLAEVLDALPDNWRRAVVLTGMGYAAESDDPQATTVATLCNVSGRTVRTWLQQARNQIDRMREES